MHIEACPNQYSNIEKVPGSSNWNTTFTSILDEVFKENIKNYTTASYSSVVLCGQKYVVTLFFEKKYLIEFTLCS